MLHSGGSLRAHELEDAELHFQRAANLSREGNLEGAIREYRLGLQAAPDAYDAYNNLGVLYFQKEDYSKAIENFQQADRLNPRDPEINFNWGLALVRLGRCESAIPRLNLGARHPAHLGDARYLLGICHYQRQEWKKAAEELAAARQSGSQGEQVLYLLFESYRRSGEPEKGLKVFEQLLQQNPDSPWVHQLLGTAYDEFDRGREAEEEFKKAIAASPDSPGLHFSLGYLYWKRRRLNEAAQAFKEEIRISPESAPSYYYLGEIAFRQRRHDQAASYLEKSVRLDPENGEAYLALGRVYSELGRDDESLDLFRKAAELLPEQVAPHYLLARTLLRLGRRAEADEKLAKVRQMHSRKLEEEIKTLTEEDRPGGPKKADGPP
ncbi:MAG: tetratricopeptide repeat protein [Acidobacteriota bacterium]